PAPSPRSPPSPPAAPSAAAAARLEGPPPPTAGSPPTSDVPAGTRRRAARSRRAGRPRSGRGSRGNARDGPAPDRWRARRAGPGSSGRPRGRGSSAASLRVPQHESAQLPDQLVLPALQRRARHAQARGDLDLGPPLQEAEAEEPLLDGRHGAGENPREQLARLHVALGRDRDLGEVLRDLAARLAEILQRLHPAN